MLKSLGIGAKHLPLSPLPPTVIQGVAMTGDNGVGKAAPTPSVVGASGNCTTVVYAFPEEEDHLVVGYLNEWINAYSFITSEYTIGWPHLYFQLVKYAVAISLDLCQGWIRQGSSFHERGELANGILTVSTAFVRQEEIILDYARINNGVGSILNVENLGFQFLATTSDMKKVFYTYRAQS